MKPDYLSQEEYASAQTLIHHCLTCSSDITSADLFCSAVCLEEDLEKRIEMNKMAKKIKAPKY